MASAFLTDRSEKKTDHRSPETGQVEWEEEVSAGRLGAREGLAQPGLALFGKQSAAYASLKRLKNKMKEESLRAPGDRAWMSPPPSLCAEQEVTGRCAGFALGGPTFASQTVLVLLSVSIEGASKESSKELAICPLDAATFLNKHSASGTAAYKHFFPFVVDLFKKPHTEVKRETNLKVHSFWLFQVKSDS